MVLSQRDKLEVYKVHNVHKVYGPLRGALSTAVRAADKHCPKDTHDLIDFIKFINLMDFINLFISLYPLKVDMIIKL